MKTEVQKARNPSSCPNNYDFGLSFYESTSPPHSQSLCVAGWADRIMWTGFIGNSAQPGKTRSYFMHWAGESSSTVG